MNNWHKIEDAPKDGTSILARTKSGNRIADAHWNFADSCWVWPYLNCEPHTWVHIPTEESNSMKMPTDAELLALNDGEVYFSESPSKYPEAGFGTQYHGGAPGVVQFARAAIQLATTTQEWYCEEHPEHRMGHDGCKGAGILECARVSMISNQLRLSKQAEREANAFAGDVAAQAKWRIAELEGASTASADRDGVLFREMVDAIINEDEAFMKAMGEETGNIPTPSFQEFRDAVERSLVASEKAAELRAQWDAGNPE